MLRRLRVPLLSMMLALIVPVLGSCGSTEPPTTVSVAGYLEAALQAVESDAYYADRVDWGAANSTADRLVKRGGSLAEARSLVRSVVLELGDNHSRLLEPSDLHEVLEPPDRVDPVVPEGDVVNDIGYIRVPAIAKFDPEDEGVSAYVRAGRMLTDRHACGWIVDLRFEKGGSVGPPLAALAPLLGQGNVLTYLRRDGTPDAYVINDAGVLVDPAGTVLAPTARSDHGSAKTPAVAVLQYLDTASAGEGVLLAFKGQPQVRTFGTRTRGVPTGNVLKALPDGGGLLLTVGIGIDRAGKRHEGPVPADEIVVEVPRQDRSRRGPTVDAALAWLRSLPACSGAP